MEWVISNANNVNETSYKQTTTETRFNFTENIKKIELLQAKTSLHGRYSVKLYTDAIQQHYSVRKENGRGSALFVDFVLLATLSRHYTSATRYKGKFKKKNYNDWVG